MNILTKPIRFGPLERVRLVEDTALKAAGCKSFAGSIPVLSVYYSIGKLIVCSMGVKPTKIMRELLKNPEARKQLKKALADESKTVAVNGTEYELVSLNQCG